jgi:hypothetical protein
MPAFTYFFKLLYPFHLSNHSSHWIAATTGDRIFKTPMLAEVGEFRALQRSLIYDRALVRRGLAG